MSVSSVVNRINPTVMFISRDQAFDFIVSGLLPLTTHYFYFERQQQSTNLIKPLGGKIGDPIITDANGQATFTYYFASSITTEKTSLDTAQKLAENVVGIKEAVLTTTNVPTLADDYRSTSLSFFATNISINVYMPPTSEFSELLQEENILIKYVAPPPPDPVPAPAVASSDDSTPWWDPFGW